MRVLILLFAASLAFAQDQPPAVQSAPAAPEPPREAEIIQVKTLTGDAFDRLVKLLLVFNNARLTSDSQMRTIVVYAPKDVVAQIKRVVEQLDRPGSEAAIGKDIEMTLTLLRCSTKPPASGAGPLPPDMEAVAKQLRAATQYKDIEIWDVLPLRLQEGRVSGQQIAVPGPKEGGQPVNGSLDIRPESVYRRDQSRYVRFDRIKIDLRVPVYTGKEPNQQFQFLSVGLNTSGDFLEGQKTVVGKVSGISDDEAIFAVIALKILD
jgi:hypothetical protein